GWFLERQDPELPALSEQFEQWLVDGSAASDKRLSQGVAAIAAGTALGGRLLEAVLEDSRNQIHSIGERWRADLAALTTELAWIDGGDHGKKSPAGIAIERQLDRLRGEYLLKELTSRGFLPGHGFPTNIVPFV